MGIYQLKEQGHDLIDELVSLGMRVNGHRGIYGVLRRRLKVREGKQHFSAMTLEHEVVNAINELKEMIVLRKRIGERRYIPLNREEKERAAIIPVLPDKILPRADRIKAMLALEEYRKARGPYFVRMESDLWIVKLT